MNRVRRPRRGVNSLWWNPGERRARLGARLTRRVREEYRVYSDRNATQNGAKRSGSAGMDRRANAAWVSLQAVKRLRLALILAGGLPIGCSGGAAEDLVIAVPPGRIADLEAHFAGPFEAATGANIIPVGLRSADQAARVRVESGNPSLDVLWIDAGEAALLAREGLIETPFGPAGSADGGLRIPNVAWAHPEAWFIEAALPATFASPIGFLYNTEALASHPASWAALEDPALEGRLALFGFGSTLGPLTVAALARIETGNETDADAGFARLARLQTNVLLYGTSGPANNQLVAQGEAWLTLGLPSQAQHLAREGAPVGWAAPAEGAIALPQGIQIVAGTRPPGTCPGVCGLHVLAGSAAGGGAPTPVGPLAQRYGDSPRHAPTRLADAARYGGPG